MNCEQQTPPSFEDDILNVLIKWIKELTGVKTIRAYENGPRPDKQYVTVFISDEGNSIMQKRNFCESDDGGMVENISTLERVVVDIKSYQDSGEHVNGGTPESTEVHRSAFDVLRALKKRHLLEGGNKILKDNCILLEDFGDIQNLRAMVKKDYESQAFARLNLIVETNEFQDIDCVETVEIKQCESDLIDTIDENYNIPKGC